MHSRPSRSPAARIRNRRHPSRASFIGAMTGALVLVAVLTGCTNLMPQAEDDAAHLAAEAEAIGMTDVESRAHMYESVVPQIDFSATVGPDVDRAELAAFIAATGSLATDHGQLDLTFAEGDESDGDTGHSADSGDTDNPADTADKPLEVRANFGVSDDEPALLFLLTEAERSPATLLQLSQHDGALSFFASEPAATIDTELARLRGWLTLSYPDGIDQVTSQITVGAVTAYLGSGTDDVAAAGIIAETAQSVAGAEPELLFHPPEPGSEQLGRILIEIPADVDRADAVSAAQAVADALEGDQALLDAIGGRQFELTVKHDGETLVSPPKHT